MAFAENRFASGADKGELALNPFVLSTAFFRPGEADSYLASVEDEAKHAIGQAELLYYRGQPEAAMKAVSALADSDDPEIRLGVFLINVISSLTLGSVKEIIDNYFALDSIDSYTKNDPKLQQTKEFFNLYFNMMIHNTEGVKLPGVSIDAFAVQEEMKPMAIFAYSHYLILSKNVGRAIGLSEGALIFMKRVCPVSEIYLCLITSVGYVSRREWDKAEYYFRYAWALAEKDRIICPFAEYRGLLSGMLERCLRYENPVAYKEITELSNIYHKNWIFVHNSITGDTVSDKLTAIEFNIAMLASRELSNTEIGECLDISVNSVRAHLRNIFNKLGIDSRKKLRDYIIK